MFSPDKSNKSYTKDSDKLKKQPVDSAISPPTNKTSPNK